MAALNSLREEKNLAVGGTENTEKGRGEGWGAAARSVSFGSAGLGFRIHRLPRAGTFSRNSFQLLKPNTRGLGGASCAWIGKVNAWYGLLKVYRSC